MIYNPSNQTFLSCALNAYTNKRNKEWNADNADLADEKRILIISRWSLTVGSDKSESKINVVNDFQTFTVLSVMLA